MYLAYFYPALYIKFAYKLYLIMLIYIMMNAYYYNFILKKYFLEISELYYYYNFNSEYLEYTLINNNLLGKHDVLLSFYTTLKNDETFINFGYNKIIIITAISDDLIFNFHSNVLINNDTSFKYYYLKVKNIIDSRFVDYDESFF